MPGFEAFLPDVRNIASDVLDGEAVIINLSTGVYYSTEGVGGWIWENISAGVAGDAIVNALTSLPGGDSPALGGEVRQFWDSLVAEQLLVPAAAPLSGELVGERPARYAPPRLSAYRDMTDLMALDPPMPMLDTPTR